MYDIVNDIPITLGSTTCGSSCPSNRRRRVITPKSHHLNNAIHFRDLNARMPNYPFIVCVYGAVVEIQSRHRSPLITRLRFLFSSMVLA